MSKHLKVKDPIFGYISVEDENLIAVINSAMFQRLRDIVQTGYPSVYPSAVHNRFVHSLGVYHLGLIAQKSLTDDINNHRLLTEDEISELRNTFLLACLMHDIGHSPFSHTGEQFYFKETNDQEQPILWQKLLSELDDKMFISDSKNQIIGAEHEIMSAYVSLVNYKNIFDKIDKSFFTRCIIGLKYSDKMDIRNCFIDLLNSKTIDVDKLDYLIRDSFTTGFKSINLDYNRLLNAVRVIRKESKIQLGFDKSALSILESVILAHDMERKWIQNHPVIQYEGKLVSYMIAKVQSQYKKKKISLFSAEALSEEGIKKGNERVCLLSDSDINSFAKKSYKQDSWITEYYAREKRKKPLWKSEAEYRTFFNEAAGVNEDVLSLLENRVESLEKQLVQKFDIPVINEDSLNFLKSEANDKSVPEQILAEKKKELEKAIGLIEFLQEYSNSMGIPFEYVVSTVTQFKTGFNKDDFKNIEVCFSKEKSYRLEKILYLFKSEQPRENYFYLYVDAESKQNINVDELTEKLIRFSQKE